MARSTAAGSTADRVAVARAALAEAERLARSRSASDAEPPRAEAGRRSATRPGNRERSGDGGREGSGDGYRERSGDGGREGSGDGYRERTGDGNRKRSGDRAREATTRRAGRRGRKSFGGANDTASWTDGDDNAAAPGEPDGPGNGPGADPEQVARSICLRLLTSQPRTRAELAAALAKRNVPIEAAEAVLDRFGEVGLINDAAFARAWVETRQRGRGLGRSALAGELRRKGVDRDVVQEALEQIDADDDIEAARRLVEKKLPGTRGLAPDKRARRLVGMLARRGHSSGLAYRVVREALAAEGTDPDLAGVPDPTLTDD
ncbi:regulatory protein RecX [Cryptosporangium aurantiacum]|uniref:Regulatory protein RecX n=1 Tax=Cryptosporangium aurantiacum TaxID=134849 RepID=A0A1M7IVE9_9ACTN|nr:regulatory protein RecX [Cryptosporangium aurantiacum]SHM44659.1 regulatory protein [Cryptosporangium aurantiacum]